MKKFKCKKCGAEFNVDDNVYTSDMDAIKKYEEERILKDMDKSISSETDGDYESEDKMVSHPSHYQSKKGIEVIDVIEAFTEDLEGIEAICTGNAIKYLCRWKNKNGIQDLEKAMWYLRHLINVLKSENKE